MRLRRSRFGAREMALLASAFAFIVALVIVWLGYRHDRLIDRLIAEGQLAQGEYESILYGSRSEGRSDQITVRYLVEGVEYRTIMQGQDYRGTEPVFEQELIGLPRLGEDKLFQIVYLPSDPSVARARQDLKKSDVAVYGAAGMFLLIGSVFGAMGLFVLRRRKGLS